MPNSRERRRSPDPRRGGPNNQLRVDMYRYLIPQIQQQDQQSGAQGYALHWDDPDAQWDKAGDIRNVWDAIGLEPIIQTLFWVLEKKTGEDIGILEQLDSLVDPFNCPEELLDDIAASFGYRLKQDLTEETKRVVVQGLFHAYKALGTRIGFDVFYRMIGFQIIKLFPLWKADVFEAEGNYSRTRYLVTPILAEPIASAGLTAYSTNLSERPIQPGSVRITTGLGVLKDDPASFGSEGLAISKVTPLIDATGPVGTINYETGEVQFTLAAPAPIQPTADYSRIDQEFPFHAARFDIEILMNPAGLPVPLIDDEVVRAIFDRLDEVRPIHVLLRALTLVVEFTDIVSPMATDDDPPVQLIRGDRDPFGGNPGLIFQAMLDQGSDFVEDELVIDTGTQRNLVMDDINNGFAPLGSDILQIQQGAGPVEIV